MSTTKRKHKIFIEQLIIHGDQVKAYQAAYPKVSEVTARKNSYRLLQNANISAKVREGVEEKEQIIKRAQREEIERLARDQVISETQIDATLSSIITGSFRQFKKVVVWNPEKKVHQTITVEVAPDASDVVAAANLLFKRKGSFAPTRLQHEAGDSFIDMMKALSAKKQNRCSG